MRPVVNSDWLTAWRRTSRRYEMKDKSRYHACPNGNDCTSPPIRNNAKGENHQGGQQGNFDKGFHRKNMRLPSSALQPLGPGALQQKSPGQRPGLRCLAVREDQYFAITGPPKR